MSCMDCWKYIKCTSKYLIVHAYIVIFFTRSTYDGDHVCILQIECWRPLPDNRNWVCHQADRIMKLLPLSLPPVTAMDRLPLSLPFSPTDLLWRYPLGFPAANSQPPPVSPLLDFKTHLPTSLGRLLPLWRVLCVLNMTLFRALPVIFFVIYWA
jgi:hypothetical protein